MITDTILIIGANGQLGSVLSKELQKIHGKNNTQVGHHSGSGHHGSVRRAYRGQGLR